MSLAFNIFAASVVPEVMGMTSQSSTSQTDVALTGVQENQLVGYFRQEGFSSSRGDVQFKVEDSNGDLVLHGNNISQVDLRVATTTTAPARYIWKDGFVQIVYLGPDKFTSPGKLTLRFSGRLLNSRMLFYISGTNAFSAIFDGNGVATVEIPITVTAE